MYHIKHGNPDRSLFICTIQLSIEVMAHYITFQARGFADWDLAKIPLVHQVGLDFSLVLSEFIATNASESVSPVLKSCTTPIILDTKMIYQSLLRCSVTFCTSDHDLCLSVIGALCI